MAKISLWCILFGLVFSSWWTIGDTDERTILLIIGVLAVLTIGEAIEKIGSVKDGAKRRVKK